MNETGEKLYNFLKMNIENWKVPTESKNEIIENHINYWSSSDQTKSRSTYFQWSKLIWDRKVKNENPTKQNSNKILE